jgi:hypothetical protein
VKLSKDGILALASAIERIGRGYVWRCPQWPKTSMFFIVNTPKCRLFMSCFLFLVDCVSLLHGKLNLQLRLKMKPHHGFVYMLS